MQRPGDKRQREPQKEDKMSCVPTLYTWIPSPWGTPCISMKLHHHNEGYDLYFFIIIIINLTFLMMLKLNNYPETRQVVGCLISFLVGMIIVSHSFNRARASPAIMFETN